MKEFELNTIRISDDQYEENTSVLKFGCGCFTCSEGYTKAYLHHLFKCSELNGHILLCMHNLYYIENLFRNFLSIDEEERLDYFKGYITKNGIK